MTDRQSSLLGPTEIRALAAAAGVRPTKTLGQNFLHDANTIRRIVRTAGVGADDCVLEVGPGLGSLTLGLLETGASVIAVEIDPVLAAQVTAVVAGRDLSARFSVVTADAMDVDELPAQTPPSALVANLPYNVSVPVLLHLLERFPSLVHGLILVQAEVAARLTAPPGSRTYGVPSAKAAWYARLSPAGSVPRAVFWPVPNVESALVRFQRHDPPRLAAGVTRADVFAVVDAAFAQRRKTLRAALGGWAGSPAAAEQMLLAAGISPQARGETLTIEQFAAIAAQRRLS